jgi:TonB-dependent starch-binding outer membrane protein SusC
MKTPTFFLIFVSLLFTQLSFASSFKIQGSIVDDKGKGMSNIIISTTQQSAGAITNAKGNFSILAASANDTLLINTFRGQVLVPINAIQNIKITIGDTITAEEFIDETVNIGYQNIKKEDATINTNTLSGEKLMATGETTIDGALLKAMPSLKRGRNGMLIIRATQSLTQQGPPLYVVNGSPTSNANNIPLSEIKDVQVLKDGSACAIYGVQGNNGVILINLK